MTLNQLAWGIGNRPPEQVQGGIRTCSPTRSWGGAGGSLPQRNETKPWQDSASRWFQESREQTPSRGSVWGAGRDTGVGGRVWSPTPGAVGMVRSVTSASLPGAVGPALLGKGPSETHGPRWAREEGGVRSTTDSPTPEGRPKTETKDGLLLRGACETKTMHAKKVFGRLGGGGGEEEEQEIKRQIQVGSQLPSLPGSPPLPRACESSR